MTSDAPDRDASPLIGRYSAPGTSPGTLRLDSDAPPLQVDVYGYGVESFKRSADMPLDRLGEWRQRHSAVWVDIDGHGSGDELRALGEDFGLHPLALEDVINPTQRAKVEAYDDHLFIVARMPAGNEGDSEQLALFLGDGWLLTIQERPGDCFDAVRQRLERDGTRIRSAGADYLAYALLDALIDAWFPVLENLGDHLEEVEDQVLDGTGDDTVAAIHNIRRLLLSLRKAVTPHRELINTLLRDDSPLISEQTSVFLRDVYDHVLRINELAETYRELSSDVMATYMSVVSNRMNEVMKVLTIIATIFIPLGFIAGLYGMNFDPASPWNMPELGWRYGYPFALGVMAGVAGVFVWWIWRKGWFD